MKTKEMFLRLVCCLLGVTCTCIAASCFYLIHMGSDPYQVFVMAVHTKLHMTYGQANMLLNAGIVLFFLAFQRKYIHVAMFLSVFYSGYCIDVLNEILAPVITASLPFAIKLVIGIFGCVLLAFGCFLYLSSNLGASPPDAVGLYISQKTAIPYHKVRIGTDLFFLFIGGIFGGVIGIVTVFAMLLTGPCIGVFQKSIFFMNLTPRQDG